jgi:non-canonical poly(A) RNA polymerase PAPD5/7
MDRREGDSYRPRYHADPGPPTSMPAEVQNAMYHFQGNANQGGRNGRRQDAPNRPPRQFKFRAPPPASERPLMTQGYVQDSTEGLTFGRDGAEDRFRNLDDLTDTDETDMDLSDDENEAPNDRPSKRTRINERGDASNMPPKWSNPDPYTALPPVDQDSRKKTNVVNLIRKARNTPPATQQDKTDSPHDDDFISFDFDDDQDTYPSTAPPDAPLGPRLGRHDVLPSSLGKRSRKEFENSPLVTPKFGQQHHADARVLEWWRADEDCDATPWVKNNAGAADSAGVALHKEIIDFYDWVRPRDYEIAVRGSVLERLEGGLLRLYPGGKLEAFGSYAAGLYLPVGDMDLVFLERNFRPRVMPNGLPPKPARRLFDLTAKFLKEQRIARPSSIQVIYFAKVPIIKFIENVSGLKIDLSFNNNTGVTANETFQSWRERYPAMPVITSVIKQYLMIRGLNDVASGGLGGFSVICLVTSLIQHMPLTSQPANLGQLLVEFFNLYGKLFNRQDVAIRLDPPGYLDVVCYLI